MNHLRQVFQGFRVVINPLGARHTYILPSQGGFQRDAAKLQGDWVRVGSALKKKTETAFERYVESANNDSSPHSRW